MSRKPVRIVFAVVLSAFVASGSRAYNERVHAWLPGAAFAERTDHLAEMLDPPEDGGGFRSWFYERASAHPDSTVRQAFLSRFPSLESFDPWALKEWLMLDPVGAVWGIDQFPSSSQTRGHTWALGARHPDDDRRNTDRFLYGADRKSILDHAGDPISYDPMITAMGGPTGISSQAHAHYQLIPEPRTDDPAILKTEPWRFSVPPDVATYGADFVQIYTDLAALAGFWQGPGAPWLRHEFQANGWHHLQDTGNQIHTVQVGTHEYFRDAWLRALWDRVRTLGGLLEGGATLEEHGIGSIRNHHLLSEELFGRRFERALEVPDPDLQQAVSAPTEADSALIRAVRHRLRIAIPESAGESSVPWSLPFGRAITLGMVDLSSREGAEVYGATWAWADRRLRGAGFEYDGGIHDPEDFVRAGSQAALEEFFRLQARGLRRSGEAMRIHDALLSRLVDDATVTERIDGTNACIRRLVVFLDDYHRGAAARRSQSLD